MNPRDWSGVLRLMAVQVLVGVVIAGAIIGAVMVALTRLRG